jgi:hypothetical protein
MRRAVVSLVLAGFLAVSLALTMVSASGSRAQPSVVSDNPANFTPNVVDDATVRHTSVDALAYQGSTLYAGGLFHSVQSGGKTFTRHNLMSFNATTGAMRPFAPRIDGQVFALLATHRSVYVGGYFNHVNGLPRKGLVKLDARTGKVDRRFKAHLDGAVQEIRFASGRLLVGGKFSGKLLALNLATGANTGYLHIPITGTLAANAGATDIYRFTVNRARTRLVAIGNFTTVGGHQRSRAFMLDLGAQSATVDPWYYKPLANACRGRKLPAYLRDVDFSPDGRYFVIDGTGALPVSGGIGRDVCDAAARFETNIASPARATWINYSGGDTFQSIAATGAAVYVQGHFRWLDNPQGHEMPGPGSVARSGIGAINPVSGKALSWNPGKTRAVGGKDLLATPAGLWVGSDGARFAGERRDNIAFLPLP